MQILKELHKKIHEEIIRLKLNQTDPITLRSENSVEFIENFLKTKMAPFVYPLIQTFFNIVSMLVIIYFIAYYVNVSSITQQFFSDYCCYGICCTYEPCI